MMLRRWVAIRHTESGRSYVERRCFTRYGAIHYAWQANAEVIPGGRNIVTVRRREKDE